MNNLKSINKLKKSIIVLSLGLILSACGGSSDDKVVVIIEDIVNAAPTISSVAVTTIESGTVYSYSLIAADADADTLTMSATGLPAWLTFDSTTGTLSGTPADTDAGDTTITLTVSDGTDAITQSFTISVTVPVPANNAAVITSTGVIAAIVGEAYTYTLVATDADSDTLTMSATISSALSWLTFDDATGILSGTPASGDIAATEITLTVNDGTEDTMQKFTITVTDAAVELTVDIISFENAPETYTFNDFDGGAAVVMANPDATGINTSVQAGQMTKSAGQTWGGSTMTLTSPVAIPAGSMVTMKVWSSRAVPVLVKFDDMNAERTVNHKGSGWEALSFDFTGDVSSSESRLTLIFDNGVMGDVAGDAANWTFYFDDFTTPAAKEAVEGNFVSVGTPYDFEATGLGSDFAWAVFENEDNPALEFVANPGSSTKNDSATVAMFTARMAGAAWAGTETTAANTTAFTMDATNSIVKVMVYKSVISDVALKFSVGAAAQGEIKVANTKINEWEELTFDFSSRVGTPETINIDSVIVFPDFTSGRASDTVSYFDNITFGHIE
jgi:hypothetical protein